MELTHEIKIYLNNTYQRTVAGIYLKGVSKPTFLKITKDKIPDNSCYKDDTQNNCTLAGETSDHVPL